MDNYFNLQKFASNGLQKEAIFGLFSPNAQKLYTEFRTKTYALSIRKLTDWESRLNMLAVKAGLAVEDKNWGLLSKEFSSDYGKLKAQRNFLNMVQDELVYGLDKDVRSSLEGSKRLYAILQKLNDTRSDDNSAYVQFYKLLGNDPRVLQDFDNKIAESKKMVDSYFATRILERFTSGSELETKKLFKHINNLVGQADEIKKYAILCDRLVKEGLNIARSSSADYVARTKHYEEQKAQEAKRGRVTKF